MLLTGLLRRPSSFCLPGMAEWFSVSLTCFSCKNSNVLLACQGFLNLFAPLTPLLSFFPLFFIVFVLQWLRGLLIHSATELGNLAIPGSQPGSGVDFERWPRVLKPAPTPRWTSLLNVPARFWAVKLWFAFPFTSQGNKAVKYKLMIWTNSEDL